MAGVKIHILNIKQPSSTNKWGFALKEYLTQKEEKNILDLGDYERDMWHFPDFNKYQIWIEVG